MADPLVIATVAILGIVALISLVLALRYRLPFRIAVRNIRRAKTRSVLVVLGLLVGTAIISGSLTVGDTVSAVNLHYTYLTWGYADEGIYSLSSTGAFQYFPASVASAIANASASIPQVAGVNPQVVDTVQVLDQQTGVPQTSVNLFGADASASRALGSFTSTSGATIAAPDPGKVLLDVVAAQALNASAGDVVTIYGKATLTATVQAVVHDDLRGAFMTAGLSRTGSIFTDLATAQQIENATGQVNYIAVTNVGSQVEGVADSPNVSAQLNRTIAATPGTGTLASHVDFWAGLNAARMAGSGLVTIFLVFGLFSIIAGAMLIVGIFAMIAEERKGERACSAPSGSVDGTSSRPTTSRG